MAKHDPKELQALLDEAMNIQKTIDANRKIEKKALESVGKKMLEDFDKKSENNKVNDFFVAYKKSPAKIAFEKRMHQEDLAVIDKCKKLRIKLQFLNTQIDILRNMKVNENGVKYLRIRKK